MDFLRDDEWFEANKGKRLGGGGARTGYACTSDPTSVIKEASAFPGSNFTENLIWAHIKDTDLAPKFGEVRAISRSGRFILMERLDSLPEEDESKAPVLPDWVRDVWPNNFGKNTGGEIKIRDYANVSLGDVLSSAEPYPFAWQLKKPRKQGL
jgi:hypothetical protein